MGLVDLDSLWRLENLTYIFLSHNKLTVMEGEGSNSSSTYLSQLVHLELASCNIAKIPNLLMHLNHVKYLDLSSNKISGDVPKRICSLAWDSIHLLSRSIIPQLFWILVTIGLRGKFLCRSRQLNSWTIQIIHSLPFFKASHYNLATLVILGCQTII